MNRKICKGERNRPGKLILFAAVLVFYSCSGGEMGFSPDLLRNSPFEVLKWTPGGGYHADPSEVSVSLSFSHNPDRASVERHFSLAGDGIRVGGTFRWEGKKLVFLPLAPLDANCDYVLSLASDAHDEAGLSMDRAFEKRFTTRPDNTRPVLVSVSPEMNGAVREKSAAVRLVFSQAVPLNSLRDYVSFDPSMNGTWLLEGEGTTGVFTPAEPWAYGKRYKITVSSSFAGNNGMTTGDDFSSVFIIGEDLEKPFLAGAWRVSKNGTSEKLVEGINAENSGWEKDDRLRLLFSRPVDTLSVKNCLSVEGAPSIRMETMPGFYDEAVFYFETSPVFESHFSFNLKKGVKDSFGNESGDEHIFRVFADGGGSKPPALAGIRFPLAPGSKTDWELISYGIESLFEDLPVESAGTLGNEKDRYPYAEKTETWIECYFETAQGCSIDTVSLAGLFRIETSNNVIVFSPRLIKDSGFFAVDPHPGWEKYQRLEIRGYLTNTVNSGIVSVLIDSGLKDSGGNRSEKVFRIPLVK